MRASGTTPRVGGQQARARPSTASPGWRPAPAPSAWRSDRCRRGPAWSAPAGRRAAAGTAPRKPGTTGSIPCGQQRPQPLARPGVGGLEVGRRPAERPAGDHHLQGVDVFRLHARPRPARPRTGACPAARRARPPGRWCGRSARAAPPARRPASPARAWRPRRVRPGPAPSRAGSASSRRMAAYFSRSAGGQHRDLRRLAGPGPVGHLQQQIGHPGGRRADRHQRPRAALDDAGRVFERRAVAQRGAAELVDLRSFRLFGHGSWCETRVHRQ